MNIFSVSEEVRNSNKLSNMVESMYEIDNPHVREENISNYKRLFTRGSSLTKEILDRIHHVEQTYAERNKTYICGYEFRVKHLMMLAGLTVLFIISLIGSGFIWFSNYFDEHVKQHMVIQNGSEAFNSWLNPSGKPMMKIHIFNYTNVENFTAGIDSKLRVVDVGPYSYEENTEKLNPVFNSDGTLSYEERRSYEFMPEYSAGHDQSDRLVVPNMPMMGVIQIAKGEYHVVKLSLSSLFQFLNVKPFVSVPAEGLIWGYHDNFFNLVRNIASFQKEFPFEHFGILAHKNKTKPDLITISTGEKDINTIGQIVNYNKETDMKHWSTADCNRMDGTDGTFFGPDIVRAKKEVSIYAKDLCRKLPYVFEKEIEMFGFATSYRYKLRANLFADPAVEPTNQCFCNAATGICPPNGIYNATPCSLGPAYISFPHFLRGDPALREPFVGLEPDEEKHSEYLDLHPTLGFAMAGVTRLQINVVAGKIYGIDQTYIFPEDEIILPVAWFDVGLAADELPQSIVDVIYRTSVTVPRIKLCLQYGSLFMVLASGVALILFIRARNFKLPERRLERNVSGLSSLLQ